MMLIHRGHVSTKDILNRYDSAVIALKPIASFDDKQLEFPERAAA